MNSLEDMAAPLLLASSLPYTTECTCLTNGSGHEGKGLAQICANIYHRDDKARLTCLETRFSRLRFLLGSLGMMADPFLPGTLGMTEEERSSLCEDPHRHGAGDFLGECAAGNEFHRECVLWGILCLARSEELFPAFSLPPNEIDFFPFSFSLGFFVHVLTKKAFERGASSTTWPRLEARKTRCSSSGIRVWMMGAGDAMIPGCGETVTMVHNNACLLVQ
jgi:hypothetical protein